MISKSEQEKKISQLKPKFRMEFKTRYKKQKNCQNDLIFPEKAKLLLK